MATPTTTYSGKDQAYESPVISDRHRSISSLSMGGARAVLSGLMMTGLTHGMLEKAFNPLDIPEPISNALIDWFGHLTFKGEIYYLQANVNQATDYQKLNQQDFDFWYNGGGTPFLGYRFWMLDALTEAKSRPFYTSPDYYSLPYYGRLDYLASTGRGQSKAALHIDKEWLNTRRKIGRYNVGHGRRVDYKYAMARFNSELEGWNLGFRFEDNRKMMYDEQRHKHQADILNIGLGFGVAARRGLATSVEGLNEARSQKAGTLGSMANGLATYSGQADVINKIQERDQRIYNRQGLNIGPPKNLAGSGDEIMKSGMGDENG